MGESILVTGATGSFGQKYVKSLLSENRYDRIVIFSRDELKQYEMKQSLADDDRLRFFLGDVRDRDRLLTATKGIDVVVHAAALKQVDTAEYNPFEFVKTNILGTQNIVDVSITNNISKVLLLSTDKASSPINLYGATKLTADKLVVAANHYSASNETAFSVVRYGNVAGSRGSLLPFLNSFFTNNKPIPITDFQMTRFWINFDQAIKFVNSSLESMLGGELFVPKIPSVKILDVIKAIHPERDIFHIGVRPGEKIHEEMISIEDAPRTIDLNHKYIVLPTISRWGKKLPTGNYVDPKFSYKSNSNPHFLTIEEISREFEVYKSQS